MRKFLAVISVLLLINCIFLFLRSGVGNTFLLNTGLFLAATVYVIFFNRLKKIAWLNYSIATFAVLYMALGAFAMIYGRQDSVTFHEDIAIVLGAGLRGEDVSPTLRSRLDMAVEFHRQNPYALIIVSGGLGPGHVISEAQAMARYLEENGVPVELIIQEGYSHSTYQNMRNSTAILEELFPAEGSLSQIPQDVVVITNDFHIFRAVRFARIAGLENVTSLHGNTPLISMPGALVREAAAIVKMWLIGT